MSTDPEIFGEVSSRLYKRRVLQWSLSNYTEITKGNTNVEKQKIVSKGRISRNGDRKFEHLLSKCSKLAQKECKPRYDCLGIRLIGM